MLRESRIMKNSMKRSMPLPGWALLAAILIGAAWLRFTGLEFGGPEVRARPDEYGFPFTLDALSQGRVFPPLPIYGGGFFFPAYLFVRVLDWVQPGGPGDLHSTILAGRAFSACLATATVLLVWRIASRLHDWRAGLLAALALAGNTLAVREAHFAKADTAAALAVAIFLLCLATEWRTPLRRARAIGAGLAIALSTKASIGVVPAAALALLGRDLAEWRHFDRRIVCAGFATLLFVFLLLNPFWLTHPKETWDFWMAAVAVLKSTSWFPGTTLPPEPLAYHFGVTARYGFGWAVTVLVVPALLFGLLRGGAARLIAIACLGQIAKLLSSPMVIARYALPVVPGLLILIAVMIVSVCDRLPWPRLWRSVALVLVALLLVVEPTRNSAHLANLLAQPDTRERAAAWIAKNVPEDGIVLSWGAPPGSQDWGQPPMGRRRVLRGVSPERARTMGARWLVRHEYPIEYSGEPLAPVGRLVAEFDPYTDSGDAPVLEPLDAFYLPIGNLGSVHRAGPRITIYDLEPSSAE